VKVTARELADRLIRRAGRRPPRTANAYNAEYELVARGGAADPDSREAASTELVRR
jgi:hypothetical protein